MTLSAAAWAGIDTVLWSAGALACLIGAAWLMTRQSRFAAARPALVFALLASAGWAIAGAVFGVGTGLVAIGEGLRNLAWIYAVYRLFAIDGRHASIKPVRPLLATLAGVVLLQMAGDLLVMARDANLFGQIGLRANVLLHLLIAIGGLVLAHNLYSGASQAGRQILRWPAATLAMLWTVDLNHYAIAYLSGANPEVTGALRGLLGVPMAGLLVLGAGERSSDLRFMPSRVVAFQSISLLLIGGYLAALVAAAQWLAFAGSDYSSLLQIAFVAVAAVTVLALSGSARLRGWLRVTVLKHLFQHRYDYRVEWLRLTRTMGQSDADGLALDQRIIRGLADLTDSPAGQLLTPSEAGDFELAARWQWPTAEVPAGGFPARLAQSIAQGGYIAEIDALRREPNPVHRLPDWLMADPRAWVVVPLLHFERMVGMVVLARPPHARQLDWEDFDLLRVVGRQLATYLAEQAGQAALVEAARFDEFNRRIAFVMHDIKNLASQMALLARNAESHADNP
ncbi:MAG TPA: PEP-CTERM system histidine kinase PrsK, partial [Novosphingobium sp.]|nr:PEP-CTERM system histidine kinase PrsK [Novosphingobium sp.]